jgi:hypothetical protein
MTRLGGWRACCLVGRLRLYSNQDKQGTERSMCGHKSRCCNSAWLQPLEVGRHDRAKAGAYAVSRRCEPCDGPAWKERKAKEQQERRDPTGGPEAYYSVCST